MFACGNRIVGSMVSGGELAVYSWETTTNEFLVQDEIILDMKKVDFSSFITCNNQCVYKWDASTLTKVTILDLQRKVIFHAIEWINDSRVATIIDGPKGILMVWELRTKSCEEFIISSSRMYKYFISKLDSTKVLLEIHGMEYNYQPFHVVDTDNGEMSEANIYNGFSLQHGLIVDTQKTIFHVHNMNVSRLRHIGNILNPLKKK